MIEVTLFLFALQGADVTEEAQSGSDGSDWWTTALLGEPTGFDWLLLLGGVIFFGLVFRGVYSMMLYNQVAANRHPANFRKVIFAIALLCCIIWFGYVFFHSFGGPILILLVAAWLALVISFFFTRRKVAPAQG